MSHVHKGCSRRCLAAILIGLACSALPPAGCGTNKNLRVPELNSKLKELSESNWDYLAALWPSDEELRRYRASLSIVPPDVVESASSEIRTYIKKEWLPANLENRLIPMKDWVRRERVVTPKGTRYALIVDALIAEFSIQGYNIQIQDRPCLGVLIYPVKPNQEIADIKDYINNSISRFLNFPPSKLGSIEYVLEHTEATPDRKLFYGKLLCEWDLAWDEPFPLPIRPRKWWNSMRVCTDGNFIFLCTFGSTPENFDPMPARISTTEDNPRF